MRRAVLRTWTRKHTTAPTAKGMALGVDPQRVNIIQGDTDAVAFGMGTGGSRSTTMSGGALTMVSDKIVAKGRKLAAHMMEASDGDIEFKDGRFTIAGTDRAMGIHEVAKAAFQFLSLTATMAPPLMVVEREPPVPMTVSDIDTGGGG